ncbi:hypothetical protein [Chitinophaga eiseniae]|uniref:Uncharacterized protein n=1 Tax=Chitinophaga eiseniae TaxID=634771 RepID=A0A847SVF8_9BACT|nr:hypothetical protein [Chitinophaga eiseniae]NLR82448.1 hypothetical protein [Chitinophaga eiseniae]
MLSKRKFRIMVGTMLVLMAMVGVLSPIYFFYLRFDGKRMYNRLKNNKQVYVNDTYNGAINSAMYVTDNSDTSALIEFYSIAELGSGGGFIKFPIRTMPYNTVFYLVNDAALYNGSKVIEVVYFDTLSNTLDYTRGLVYKGTVHMNPPSDSLLIRKDKFH